MDKINFILNRLEIDISIIYNFFLFTFMYFFLKYTIFNKLKEIVSKREENTKSLDHLANKKMQEAESLEKEYSVESSKIHRAAQDFFSEQKTRFDQELSKEIKAVSDEYYQEFNKEKEKIEKHSQKIKENILAQSEALSQSFLQKLQS